MSNPTIGAEGYGRHIELAEASLAAYERAHDRELNAGNPVSRFVLHGIASYRRWQADGYVAEAEMSADIQQLSTIQPLPPIEHTDF